MLFRSRGPLGGRFRRTPETPEAHFRSRPPPDGRGPRPAVVAAGALGTVLRLGDVMPLLTSATGRCFAAYLPPTLIAPKLKAELALAQKMNRRDVPTTQAQAQAMLDEVRTHGIGRVVDTLLPGVVGFCAPVFDSDRHIIMGVLSLGPSASFEIGRAHV